MSLGFYLYSIQIIHVTCLDYYSSCVSTQARRKRWKEDCGIEMQRKRRGVQRCRLLQPPRRSVTEKKEKIKREVREAKQQ